MARNVHVCANRYVMEAQNVVRSTATVAREDECRDEYGTGDLAAGDRADH